MDSKDKAIDLIEEYGWIDGAHHKQWVLDQVIRTLLGSNEEYEAWVACYESGSEGPHTFEWDIGIAP